MEIIFLPQADEELAFWKKSGSKNTLRKIAQLIRAITENPYFGIGKPEQLKHEFFGLWSRRINSEHRILYRIDIDVVKIYSLKGHYIR